MFHVGRAYAQTHPLAHFGRDNFILHLPPELTGGIPAAADAGEGRRLEHGWDQLAVQPALQDEPSHHQGEASVVVGHLVGPDSTLEGAEFLTLGLHVARPVMGAATATVQADATHIAVLGFLAGDPLLQSRLNVTHRAPATDSADFGVFWALILGPPPGRNVRLRSIFPATRLKHPGQVNLIALIAFVVGTNANLRHQLAPDAFAVKGLFQQLFQGLAIFVLKFQ